METRMSNVEQHLKTILEKMEILEARELRRGKVLDKLVDDELERDEVYKSIKKHVFGTGIVMVLSMLGAILWYAFRKYVLE